MASPQKENGYTALSNELLERFVLFDFPSASPLKIWLFVARKTYGYHKKSDYISINQIAKNTHLSVPTVVFWLDWLVKSLLVLKGSYNQKGTVYGLNKDYETWVLKPLEVLKRKPPGTKRGLRHKRNNNKRNNTYVSFDTSLKKSSMQYIEPVIQLDENGEEITPTQPHSGKFGKYTRLVAQHYADKQNKVVTGQTMGEAKQLLMFIHSEFPKDDNASLAKEAKSAINLTAKYYAELKVENWGLLKVIENWKKL